MQAESRCGSSFSRAELLFPFDLFSLFQLSFLLHLTILPSVLGDGLQQVLLRVRLTCSTAWLTKFFKRSQSWRLLRRALTDSVPYQGPPLERYRLRYNSAPNTTYPRRRFRVPTYTTRYYTSRPPPTSYYYYPVQQSTVSNQYSFACQTPSPRLDIAIQSIRYKSIGWIVHPFLQQSSSRAHPCNCNHHDLEFRRRVSSAHTYITIELVFCGNEEC